MRSEDHKPARYLRYWPGRSGKEAVQPNKPRPAIEFSFNRSYYLLPATDDGGGNRAEELQDRGEDDGGGNHAEEVQDRGEDDNDGNRAE